MSGAATAQDMDCTFDTKVGRFNFRVGLIITSGRKILMARNPNEEPAFYYSVGGRVKYGESLEAAALREAKEETGLDCELDRLACIHENFFTDPHGTAYHEISCFFTVKPDPELLKIEDGHKTDDGPAREYLSWVDMESCSDPVYPEFFKTVDFSKSRDILHFVTRD